MHCKLRSSGIGIKFQAIIFSISFNPITPQLIQCWVRPLRPSTKGKIKEYYVRKRQIDNILSTIWLRQEHDSEISDGEASGTEPRLLDKCYYTAPRGTEKNGVEYLFLSEDEFRKKIADGEFLEYEEVYPGRFYGTLKSQVDSQTALGENVVFDVDVKGGCNIKKFYGSRALSIFIQAPSIDELKKRLEGRGTDSAEAISKRIAKASYEMTFAPQFDHIVVNDDLEKAEEETYQLVKDFI